MIFGGADEMEVPHDAVFNSPPRHPLPTQTPPDLTTSPHRTQATDLLGYVHAHFRACRCLFSITTGNCFRRRDLRCVPTRFHDPRTPTAPSNTTVFPIISAPRLHGYPAQTITANTEPGFTTETVAVMMGSSLRRDKPGRVGVFR